MLKKHPLTVFFALALLQSMGANFAHPITPTIIKNLHLPDAMFGLAFAAMSFTNFLFSPFWGKIRAYCCARTLLLVGCCGYALGQFFFCNAHTQTTILLARCFSGIFISAVSVAMLIHILELSPKEKTGENLARLAILQSLGAALGYLAGGVLGVYSIPATFTLQVITLVFSGVLFFVTIDKTPKEAKKPVRLKSLIKDANPFRAFLSCKVFMNKSFFLLFAVVLFAYLGSNAFDQSFNYYIKDQFQFTSAYNGLVKAVIGIITLVSNSTICLWLIRHANIKQATAISLLCCTASIFLLLPVHALSPFILICILFFACNSIFIPLLQDSIAKESDTHSALVMGFYNAVKSLGMIGGALIAGGIYGFGPKLPFAFAGLCFAGACILMMGSSRKLRLPASP